VVITVEMRPDAVTRHMRPICQYPEGRVKGTFVGRQEAAAAAVRTGPSV
jgi:hypothetical protein